MKGIEQTPGENCPPKLATISTPRDPKGRFTKATATAPGLSKPKPAAPAKKASASPAKENTPAQEQTPDQDQDEDSSEYESSSEEETPGPAPRYTQAPRNPQAPQASETPEHQDLEKSPDQEQLHQEGAPKPNPEQDPEILEPPGPAPPASLNQPPTRRPSPSQEPPPSSPESSPPASPRPAIMSLQPEGSNRPIDYQSPYPIYLFTDASKVEAGAWIGQGLSPEKAHPATFHSGKFPTSLLHYPIHELELLAVVDAVQSFHPQLYGIRITVVMDNKALSYFLS